MGRIIQMNHKYLSLLKQIRSKLPTLLYVLLVIAPESMALPDDKKQPLHVIADGVVVDYAQGVTHLEGNVKVTQGSTILQGDTVVVYTDNNQNLTKLVATGGKKTQASYETLPSPNDKIFHATADTITYVSGKKLAIFEGDAHASDGMNQFDGPEFEYFTDEQKVVTQRVANQHSSIIIYPGTRREND